MYPISDVTSVQQTMVKVETKFPDKQRKGIGLYCTHVCRYSLMMFTICEIPDGWIASLQSGRRRKSTGELQIVWPTCKSGSNVRTRPMNCFPAVYGRLLKYTGDWLQNEVRIHN